MDRINPRHRKQAYKTSQRQHLATNQPRQQNQTILQQRITTQERLSQNETYYQR